MSGGSFWFFDWLDAYSVTSLRDANRALQSGSTFEAIREFAVKAVANSQPLMEPDFSLVAGRGLDLSGHLDCNASACRLRQVDTLFRHAWHYFDRIVVADAVSHEVSMHWDAPRRDLKRWLLSHIEVLLHLRKLGAERLVVFREKPAPCEVHWDRHAAEAGLQGIVADKDALADELLQLAHVDAKDGGDGSADFIFVHPEFEHSVWGTVVPSEAGDCSPATIRHAAAVAVVRRYLAHLTSDVRMGRMAAAPLGSTVWFHGQILRRAGSSPAPSDVALELELPILEAVPLETLLKLRTDERDAFVRFRYKLRQAAREQLKAATSSSPAALAQQISQDLVEPEVERIRQRLASAQRMLAKRTAVGVTLGGLVTVCGLLAGVAPPLATAAGVGAMTTVAGGAAAKDLDERREIGLSDMYFVWKAVEHAQHPRSR